MWVARVVDEVDDDRHPGFLDVAEDLVGLAPVEDAPVRFDPVPANRVAEVRHAARTEKVDVFLPAEHVTGRLGDVGVERGLVRRLERSYERDRRGHRDASTRGCAGPLP